MDMGLNTSLIIGNYVTLLKSPSISLVVLIGH